MVYEFPSLPLIVIFFGFCRDARTSTYYKRYKKLKKKYKYKRAKVKQKQRKKINKQQNKQKQRNDLPKYLSLKCNDRLRRSKIKMTCNVSWLGTQHTHTNRVLKADDTS